MKNLKNMLFAAAIGAVLVPMVAGAKNVTSDTTITTSNISDYKTDLVVKAGKTLTINSDAVTADSCSGATKTNKTECEAASGTWTDAVGPTSIKLESGAKLVDYSKAAVTPTADGDLQLYSMISTAVNHNDYVADAKLNVADGDFTKANKTIYYEAKEQEITIAAPEILGNYRFAEEGTNYTVSDKKAVISKETAKNGTDVTITFKAGDGVAAHTVTYDVKFIKKATYAVNNVDGKNITENQDAVNAVIADYISVMNNDKAVAKKVFAVKGLTTDALTDAGLAITPTYDVQPAAAAKTAIEKVVSGLTKINDEIKYFNVTATIGGQNITDISSTGKKFTVIVDTDLTDVVVPEGKAIYVINYHEDNANTAANIVDKNAKLTEDGKLTFTTNQFSTFAVAIGDKVAETTPAAETPATDSKETNTGDATKEANPKTSDNVMTSVVSLLVSAFGLTAAGLKLKNN